MLSTADANRWREVLPARVSVLGSLEHVKICEQQTGGAGRLFVIEAPDPVVAYPFFVRPVHDLPFAADFAGGCDTFTPLYTGPIGLKEWSDAGRCASLFERYCREQGIVAEFAHLNPWSAPEECLDSACVEINREIVYVDLTWTEAKIWSESMNSDSRRQTKQAKAAGVRIRRAESRDDVARFHQLHTETMDRRQAQERYYYPPEHFQAIFESMPKHAFFVLAEHDDRLVAGGLFFEDAENVYWDLSAADMNFARVRPVNAYLHDTICRSLGQGKKRMLLGAGYQPGDGVFRFKASYSPLRARFCTYKKVHDAGAYAALTQAWSRHYPGAPLADDFFPAYRANAATPTEARQS